MIQTILIGSPKIPPNPQGGIGLFIHSVLRYPPLVRRLALAAIVWGAFEWLRWTVPAGLGFLALEVYASLLALRMCADLLGFGQSGRILKAMSLPIAVILVAVYLLFFNDQGRELGLGLIDLNKQGLHPDLNKKGLYLAVTLVYWASNNWLSARIGLTKNFAEPANDQFLLFWGPRIVGVCAHLLAAFSLAVAASKQPALQGIQERWLVVAAPVAIVLATVFAWLLDESYISERYPKGERPRARKLMYAVGAVEFALLGALVLAVANKEKQAGLSLAALCITGSALFFLILISVLRKERPLGPNATAVARTQDQAHERQITVRWTLGLALVTLIVTALTWKWPMHVGQSVGSLTVACFSFGAFLALVNFAELVATQLTNYAQQSGFNVQRPTVWALLICFLAVPAVPASVSHPFHRVRLCGDSNCTPIAPAKWAAIESPDKRPSISEAALAWYAQAEPAYHAVHPNEPVPMLIVATAGGGIRAAYWTATILENLEDKLRWSAAAGAPSEKIPTESPLRHLLFAISGVSGGSVGAAAYAAALHDHEVTGADIMPTNYLQGDFLAPGLASMVFIDGPANLLPNFGQIDRGQALELGFEAASSTPTDNDGLLSHTFLSFFPTMAAVAEMKSWRPALLLNATHEETGRRIIASHIKIERGGVFDSYDALQLLNADIRLSTAAHNSARFTYISPAGNLSSAKDARHTKHFNRGYVIDGGYFENYGAETALELAHAAIEAIKADDPEHPKVKPVILQISSDPTLEKDRTLVRVDMKGNDCSVSSFEPQKDKSDPADPANYLELKDRVGRHKNEGEGYVLPWANELSAPFVGIMSVREAHGTIAAEELASSVCKGKNDQRRAALNQSRNVVPEVALSTTIGSPQTPPHFAHFAMCERSTNGNPGVTPPLGWVLSDRTRERFKDIFKDCDNPQELTALASALGLTLRP